MQPDHGVTQGVPPCEDTYLAMARARALCVARGGFVVYMHNFMNILHKYANRRKKINKRRVRNFISRVQNAENKKDFKKRLHIYSIGAKISSSKTFRRPRAARQ